MLDPERTCSLMRHRLGIWRVYGPGPGKPGDAVSPPKSRGKGRCFANNTLPEQKSLLFSGHTGLGQSSPLPAPSWAPGTESSVNACAYPPTRRSDTILSHTRSCFFNHLVSYSCLYAH